jgi:hypothetical protein
MYDSSDPKIRGDILPLAISKLLFDSSHSKSIVFTINQECAVLSQRLALDINSSTYVTSGSTRNYDMLNKVQTQIANHMRVCIGIPQDLTTVHSIAASEPLLSEAASYIMKTYDNFDLCKALMNVLDSYAINHGEQGELLVAAFFTWARDFCIQHIHWWHSSQSPSLSLSPFCPIFSVMDLLSSLFQEEIFRTMSHSLPSVHRADFSSQKKFKDVFKNTKIHFNHMVQPIGRDVITRAYLLAIMARGAAALGANCQPGYDMVYPFLYDTKDLVAENVGFILVQVKNYAGHIPHNFALFRKMDPFYCNLLKDKDNFTIPIIRIVFALGEVKPSLTHITYKSPKLGCETFDGARHPRFTSYDFWCSGIGPKLLWPVKGDNDDDDNVQTFHTPVRTNNLKNWKQLLGKTSRLNSISSASEGKNVRCSQYPGGGKTEGHYNAWMNSNILD